MHARCEFSLVIQVFSVVFLAIHVTSVEHIINSLNLYRKKNYSCEKPYALDHLVEERDQKLVR